MPPTDARPPDRAPLAGALTVVLAASLFAWLGPLSRWAYEAGMTPLPFVAWRASLGTLALVVAVVILVRRGARLVRPAELGPRDRLALAAATASALLLNLAIFAAFQRTSIAIALLGFYTYPAIVAAVSVAMGRERMTVPKLGALGLATGGMVLVVAGGGLGDGAGPDPLGVALALGASLCQVLFVVVSRDGYRQVPADQAMTVILGGSALGAIVLSVIFGFDLGLPLGEPGLLGLLVAAGVLGAALPSLLFLAGIRWIGGLRTGILMLLEPVVGAILAALLLAEPLGPVQVAGGVAILVAAWLIQRAPELPREPTEPAEPAEPTEPVGPGEAGDEGGTPLAPIPGGP